MEGTLFLSNNAFLLPTDDRYLLGVLNSPLLWSYYWRNAQHAKDEALRLIRSFLSSVPIPEPTEGQRRLVEANVNHLIALSTNEHELLAQMLDWLTFEHGIKKHGNKLSDFPSLNRDEFAKEVEKRRPKSKGKLSSSELREVFGEFDDLAHRVRKLRAQKLQLEHAVSDAVMDAYELTDEERELVWDTAPPRMPFDRPIRSVSHADEVDETNATAAMAAMDAE